jgi:hypothetical protein
MLTHVEFRSSAFPAYESEEQQVNPGRFGKRLADYLVSVLGSAGEFVGEPIAEDWGWVVPIDNAEFRLWIGVGNYEEYPDGFLCFIEPSKEYVRKLFRKISTKARVETIQRKLDDALRSHSDVRDLKWWTADEFNEPAA